MAAAPSCSATSLYPTPKSSAKPPKLTIKFSNTQFAIGYSFATNNLLNLSSTSSSTRTCATPVTSAPFTASAPSSTTSSNPRHWIVLVKSPPKQADSKPEVIDYYVKILQRVLGSEKDAQMCIYNASCDTHFGFCCDVDEETSLELACLPEVLSVRPDLDFNTIKKDYTYSKVESCLSSSYNGSSPLFPLGNSKHWLVQVETPATGVITKAQVVDYYSQILTKVMGNEKDAQMCIYHISLQSNYGFCCELDDECAKELASVPGVLSVQPDENADSDNKDYGGNNLEQHSDGAGATNQPTNIKTKKLFVTGLSFYTSEKTLHAAFEGFGELVEVKIIMDKISKRSKGFAFVEYTTEEAASAALREMNGKIINGWMIIVDVAKTSPPKYSRGRPRTAI